MNRLDENLGQASELVAMARERLTEALSDSSAVEALILLQALSDTTKLLNQIDSLHFALAYKSAQ